MGEVEDVNQGDEGGLLSATQMSMMHQPDNGAQKVEIALSAKNAVTLDEYKCNALFQNEYIAKLEKWISKGRYSCSLIEDSASGKTQLNLVVEIFNFILDKVERDDIEMLKDEFKNL